MMKTIGLIGGMSWESTALYYQELNEEVRARMGGLHSARIILDSFNFADITTGLENNDWNYLRDRLLDSAIRIEKAGADCILICTNTMHKLAKEADDSVSIPLLSIIDVTAKAMVYNDIKRPLLLGTRHTMAEPFFKEALKLYGIEASVPDSDSQRIIHDIIFEELCRGIKKSTSRSNYMSIIESEYNNNIDGVIFGCTEIGLIISDSDINVPVFDALKLHAHAAVDFALSESTV